VRLFVAVALPPPARAALASVCGPLRDSLPSARWVPAEQWHVTLWFLGDTVPPQVEPLVSALGTSLDGVAPFSAELGGGGSYPAHRAARVAWIGFADGPGWAALGAAMLETARALGREVEDRPFRPHVTVARPRPPWPPAVARRWRDSLPDRLGDPFVVSAALLCRSELGPEGARHETLAELSLRGAR
jgi:2'-5' RNA ligase